MKIWSHLNILHFHRMKAQLGRVELSWVKRVRNIDALDISISTNAARNVACP
jgi:hypothetical protein